MGQAPAIPVQAQGNGKTLQHERRACGHAREARLRVELPRCRMGGAPQGTQEVQEHLWQHQRTQQVRTQPTAGDLDQETTAAVQVSDTAQTEHDDLVSNGETQRNRFLVVRKETKSIALKSKLLTFAQIFGNQTNELHDTS